MLWHEFMKEYSSLGDWLRLAEKSADSPRSAHVLFVTAKEELKKFEVKENRSGHLKPHVGGVITALFCSPV